MTHRDLMVSWRNAHLVAFPIRVPAIAIFGPTICVVVVNAASFSGAALPPFSSVPLSASLRHSWNIFLPNRRGTNWATPAPGGFIKCRVMRVLAECTARHAALRSFHLQLHLLALSSA